MVDFARHSIFGAGARLFDEGRYFEAHEAWEAHWLAESDATRRLFLQGLIQIAAGFHKLVEKGSRESAARLFARGLAKLDACPSPMEGVDLDLATFRDGVRACVADLAAAGSGRARIPRLVR